MKIMFSIENMILLRLRIQLQVESELKDKEVDQNTGSNLNSKSFCYICGSKAMNNINKAFIQ
jgi:hypothetical protein